MGRRIGAWLLVVGSITAVAWADVARIPKRHKTRPKQRVGPRIRYINTLRRPPRLKSAPAQRPAPKPQPTSRPAEIGPMPVIRMRSAKVVAEIRKPTEAERPGLPRHSAKAADSQWLIAEVTCDFELRCLEVKKPPGEYWMAFPIYAKGDPDCRVRRFDVTIDGKKVDEIETLGDWRVPLPDVGVAAKDRGRPASGRRRPGQAPKQRIYYGYQWPATARQGATHRVKLAYRLLLPVRSGGAFFRYVLRSAATWSGRIAQETITIKSSGGLRLEPPESTRLKPKRQKDGSWVWTLRDARPIEDIVLHVSLPEPAAAVGDKR